MAIPKSLKKINYDDAMRIIKKHTQNNTGWWESRTPMVGDFVYEAGAKHKLIRPGFTLESWETGVVSM